MKLLTWPYKLVYSIVFPSGFSFLYHIASEYFVVVVVVFFYISLSLFLFIQDLSEKLDQHYREVNLRRETNRNVVVSTEEWTKNKVEAEMLAQQALAADRKHKHLQEKMEKLEKRKERRNKVSELIIDVAHTNSHPPSSPHPHKIILATGV